MTLQLAQTMMPQGWSGISYEGINLWDYINTSSDFHITRYGSETAQWTPYYTNLRLMDWGNWDGPKEIYLPSCNYLGQMFYICYNTRKTTVNFSKINSIERYCFYHCGIEGSYTFPKVSEIGNYAFGGLNNRNSLYLTFPNLTYIASQAFCGRPNNSIYCYLTGSVVPSFPTPDFISSYIYFYVPFSMYSLYISEWSTISSCIYSM